MAGLGGKLCPHTTKEELPKVVQEQPRQVLKRGKRDSCRCSYPHTGEVPREPKEVQGGAALGKTHQIYDLKWSLGGRLVGGSWQGSAEGWPPAPAQGSEPEELEHLKPGGG